MLQFQLPHPVLQFQSTSCSLPHPVLQFQSSSSSAPVPVYLIQCSGSSLPHPVLKVPCSLPHPVLQFQSSSFGAPVPVFLIQCSGSSLPHPVLQFQSSSFMQCSNFSLVLQSRRLSVFFVHFFIQISLYLNNNYYNFFYNDIHLWSAIGVKIVFKMSALCGEYISQRIYKYVDVYNKYVDLLYISQRIYKYVDVYNKYVDLLINAATYL